jgi:hypothetical protein
VSVSAQESCASCIASCASCIARCEYGSQPCHQNAEIIALQATSNPARWVLAVREESPVQCAEDLAGTIIASELMETTKQ